MSHTTELFVTYGRTLVFAAVFAEQMGLPLPAFPWLLTAGALAADGKFNLGAGLALVVVACLLADSVWFQLGRSRGYHVLRLLCRISLEPDSCVRQTQNVFTKYGLRSVLVNKFLPGISTIVPPLAGMTGVRLDTFLLLDTAASLLYGGILLSLGFLFSNQIDQIGVAATRIGTSLLHLFVAAFVLYVAYKYWQRRRLLRELRMTRITAEELRRKLDAGEPVVILDVRPAHALELNDASLPGAVHLEPDRLGQWQQEIPRDRDIVVYCSCPNEFSAAHVALALKRSGFTRVRPLHGGFDAWRLNNFPTETAAMTATTSTSNVLPGSEPASVNPPEGPVSVSTRLQPAAMEKDHEIETIQKRGNRNQIRT